ncbi:MAG: efflux transporter outer membrane subunit [Ramlibacter sp.]|nr:efflux transporter outer membrane subunit [Ramlibacter sp.]
MTALQRTCTWLAPLWLAACASPPLPPPPEAAAVPAHWHAPLPHHGDLADLGHWWEKLGDPVLVELVAAAQNASPTLASARSRVLQARAARTSARAALGPTLDASVSASRGNAADPSSSPLTVAEAGLQAGWEIDLFGANLQAARAADARLEGATALWHDARVSVAAEVANQYFSRRACERLLTVARSDGDSRQQTARLSDLSAKAGFTAPGTAALARASAAEARARLTQQQAACDIDLKALVALTALSEPDLKQKLASAPASRPQDALFSIASVPARVIAQRPDVFNAERDVVAAAAELGQARAQRLPRLSLNGSISTGVARAGGVSTDFQTWSLGPLTLNLPLFDGGRRAAGVDAAQARYDEAVALYTARVRQAVREVEEALVNLQSTADRRADAELATEGYRASFNATQSRYQAGLASLVELEDARRTALAAETALVTLERERDTAWTALYRAAGGGWTPDAPTPTDTALARP